MPGTIATTVLMTLLLLGVAAVALRQHRLLARHRQTLAELRLARHYQTVVDQAHDCIIVVDARHRIVDINERCLTIYGYGRQEMLAMTESDLLPPEERAVWSAQSEVTKRPARLLYEARQRRKDGSIFLGEISQVVGEIDGQPHIHKIVRDITERKANEAHLLQMSRLSVTLSAVNHAIAHSQSIEEVFDIACRACVRLGGFKLAWVGLVDKKSGLLRIANSWGDEPDFLKDLLINTSADISAGSCPSATAFRDQQPCICDDFANDPITLPWRDEAARHGIGASVSLPISRDQVPMGVLTAYSDHANSFDVRARDLLGEIAESLSFAVHHFAELTAKRQTENALKKREMQLLKAEEHAKLGHWEIDLENGEKVWSPQMYQLFERAPADGPVNPDEAYAGYYTADSARLTEQSVRQAIITGQRVQLEQELHFPNARTAFHATLLVPIRNEQGRTIALHGTVQDVTEHKLNETRLARMASRLAQAAREYEDLYQNAPCGYHSLDRDGVIQRINDTELNWLGYTRDEVIGKMKFSDLLPVDRAAGFSRSFPLLIESGQLSDLEQNLICKDGSLLPVLINATVIRDESGHFLMSRSTTYNMTERKKVEKEREEYTRRLALLSRRLVNMQEEERKRLSASLHDRTSPNLAAIGINLSIIGMPGAIPVAPELAERLEDIRALVDDTTASIREISADLRPPLLDYAGLLPALEGYLHQYSKRTGTATRFECADVKTRPSLELETLLFRIAQEALTNCAKHAAATAIDVTLTNERNGILLTIRDNGIGFDPEELGKGTGGIGLGMLNMREMTEFAGGRFVIDSRPGHGTLIRVEM